MSIAQQKVRTFAFIILGYSGFHSHHFQYMQKVHTHSVNIRYISESDSNCGRMNSSLIKQMLIYVCRLSVVLCHRLIFCCFHISIFSPLFYAVGASGILCRGSYFI